MTAADFIAAQPIEPARPSLWRRLLSLRAADLLARNTVVSVLVFAIGLGLLWLLVEQAGMAKLPATAVSFLVANSIHYAFGRAWIYRDSDRSVGSGYAFFIVNALVGLAVTLAIFAFLTGSLGVGYIGARIIASLFAGLALFLLNAVANFRSL